MRLSLLAVLVLFTSAPVVAAERHASNAQLAWGRKAASRKADAAPADAPIALKELAKLKDEIRAKTMPNDKVARLKKAAATDRFTSGQAYQLVELFEDDEDKLAAINILTKRLTDPKNAPELRALVKQK